MGWRPQPLWGCNKLRCACTYNAGYSYLADSPLVSQISCRSNSTVRMTTTKQYDYQNPLMSISSAGIGAAASPIASTYLDNDAHQRVQVRQADGTYWLYEYDKLGQLTSGKTPVSRQWIAERLHIGSASYVSYLVKQQP